MQRPRVPNEDITDLQLYGLQSNFTGFSGSKRFLPRHTVGAWRNFDRAILQPDADQAKADDQQIRGKREVRSFSEQRTLIVGMKALILRTLKGHVVAPLIGNDPVVHRGPYDSEHVRVEEEFWDKARRRKRHREKVAMRATIRLVTVGFKILTENRPEGVSARIDQGPRKVFSEHTIALVLKLDKLVLNCDQVVLLRTSKWGSRPERVGRADAGSRGDDQSRGLPSVAHERILLDEAVNREEQVRREAEASEAPAL
jgi:hypothetical protein